MIRLYRNNATKHPSSTRGSDVTSSLSCSHRIMLEESGIDPAIAAERGYRSVGRGETAEALSDFPKWQRRLGLYIPMYSPSGATSAQLRPDKPRRDRKGKPRKYETPGGSRVSPDAHPRMLEAVRHGDGELFVTEGCKKLGSV